MWGEWYVKGQPPYPRVWGLPDDVPVPADYDGDGTTDIAVFRPSEGRWYVKPDPARRRRRRGSRRPLLDADRLRAFGGGRRRHRPRPGARPR